MWFAEIVLPLYLTHTLTYSIPEDLRPRIADGCRVVVPLGRGKYYTGIVVRVHRDPVADMTVKSVAGILGDAPIVDRRHLDFWMWISSYYLCTLGEVLNAAVPSRLLPEGDVPEEVKDRRTVRSRKKEVSPVPLRPYPTLTEAQQNAYQSVLQQGQSKSVVLLHGVTSSGKTEIYLHLIRDQLARSKQVLYLLPEIALTTQLVTRLKTVLGDRIGVYHSGASEPERCRVWTRVRTDDPATRYDVVIGVRSALFLPFSDLGLIIIDEEQDASYKQYEPSPRYHARDAAIMLARQFGAGVLLGTATPSLESYHNALTGKYGLVELKQRYQNMRLPRCTVADMRLMPATSVFHRQLVARMEQALRNGMQVILFRNRRGFATYMQCDVCGAIPKCTKCDVSLTYHKHPERLQCHYCGASWPVSFSCPSCHAPTLRAVGSGTEKIEEEVRRLFPDARVLRLDWDISHSRGQYEQVLSDFAAHNADVLVGTQMVTKGLDFDKVQLIGILEADQLFHFPDFRSYERAFQLMVQVSGRAGRKETAGEVVIQTRDPLNPLLQQVLANDYTGMYQIQMTERRAFGYPPYVRLIRLVLKHKVNEDVQRAAQELVHRLTAIPGIQVLGPQAPVVARVQRWYLQHVLVKIELSQRDDVKSRLAELLQQVRNDRQFGGVRIMADVDPV